MNVKIRTTKPQLFTILENPSIIFDLLFQMEYVQPVFYPSDPNVPSDHQNKYEDALHFIWI